MSYAKSSYEQELINDCELCDGIGRVYQASIAADGEPVYIDVVCPRCLGKRLRRHTPWKKRSLYKQEFMPFDNATKIPLQYRTTGVTWMMGGTGITWFVMVKVNRRRLG